MKKSTSMSIKDCFAMLGIPEGSSLDDIKRAYRKRAFELHPDLNPSDGATRQFQQLNEAYVILIRLAEPAQASKPADTREPDAASAKTGRNTYEEQAKKDYERQEKERARQEKERQEKERREQQEAARREREAHARQVKEQQLQQEKERREEARRTRLREEIERQEADRLSRQEKTRQDKEAKEETRRAEQENLERQRVEQLRKVERQREEAARENQKNETSAQSSASRPESHRRVYSGQTSPGPDAKADNERENLISDLLHDPFARRVYEDIYREVQHRKQAEPPPKAESPPTLLPPELAKGISKAGSAIKGWLRGQIDEEQVMFFPAANLSPGARIRLQIRRGLTGELKTVEVTLPPDFAVGKPVRLRGMGKKIGTWQGDLYLTFQTK